MSDLIKRQDAINALKQEIDNVTPINDSADGHYRYALRLAKNIIRSLPSADRPTVNKEYLIDLIQEAVYDGEACAKLIDMVDGPTQLKDGTLMIVVEDLYAVNRVIVENPPWCKVFYEE